MEPRLCLKPGHRLGKYRNRFLILAYSEQIPRKSLPVLREARSTSDGLACEIDNDLRILRHVPTTQVPKHQRRLNLPRSSASHILLPRLCVIMKALYGG